MRKNKWIMTAALGVAALFGVNSASANSIHLQMIGEASAGPNFTYTYQATVDQLNTVNTNDGFVIFDFDGYVAGSYVGNTQKFADGSFSFSYGALPSVAPTTPGSIALLTASGGFGDNPLIGNLNLKYTSATAVGYTGSGSTVGITSPTFTNNELILGTFTVTSTLATPRFDSFYAQDHNVGTLALDQNQGQVQVAGTPGGESPLPAAVWGGMGLMGLVASKKRLVRKMA
jgi:hypothetical protein